jgi:hypothetical protein
LRSWRRRPCRGVRRPFPWQPKASRWKDLWWWTWRNRCEAEKIEKLMLTEKNLNNLCFQSSSWLKFLFFTLNIFGMCSLIRLPTDL